VIKVAIRARMVPGSLDGMFRDCAKIYAISRDIQINHSDPKYSAIRPAEDE
jgi:hypothetical protein